MLSHARTIHISRRSFVRRCATLAAATGLPLWFIERQLLGAEPAAAPLTPNNRPGIALIGCGGMGTGDGRNAANHGELLVVCDVDRDQAAKAAQALTPEGGRAPEICHDFREVLARKDIHVIINGTPDHWHTLINLGAVRAGKDVYSEKPLTLTVDEGRRLVREATARGTVLQTGTQQRSSERFRLACELIRNGRIGKLSEVKVWLPAGLREGPFATAPVPEALNWDYWLGPAPKVDYVPERCHRTFRFWYDYSGGTMTDWGAHHNDIAYWAIGQRAPARVESTRLAEPIPGGYDAISEYEVRYTYADGTRLKIMTTRDDSIFGAKINPDGQRNGIRFEGSDGWIWVNRSELTASDMDLLRAPLPDDATRLYVSRDHMGNFFDCVRSREKPICDVETGHLSANMCHLGAISLRTGHGLSWDAEREVFTGDHAKEANTYLARELRKPYDYSFV